VSAERRSRHIASIGKAFTALNIIAERLGITTAKDLSVIMKMPLPTTYHLLNTLLAEGVLVRGERQGYLLGPRIGAFSDFYFEQGEPVATLEEPLRALAARTGESVYLSGWRHGDIEVVASAEGKHAVLVAQLQRGAHGNANARASGKVLLAFARPGLRADYLRNHAFTRFTEKTITDPELFKAELEIVKERGFAFDLEEFAGDVCCVSAPILSAGHILGAYTVSSPSSRFAGARESIVEALLAACRDAESTIVAQQQH